MVELAALNSSAPTRDQRVGSVRLRADVAPAQIALMVSFGQERRFVTFGRRQIEVE